MTREEAIDIVRKNYPHAGVSGSQFETALRNLIPELRESEDEEIRKEIIEVLRFVPSSMWEQAKTNYERCFAYLEKQKDAFENGRQLGIMQEQARQELEGTDEKQKEQKPVDFPTTDKEVKEFLEAHSKVEVPEKYKTPDFVFSKQEYESYPIISKDTTSVKLAEWSEEDEDMLNSCISSIEEAKENRYAYKETDGDTSYDLEISFLKSLRPQPHWKPSEEQMKALIVKED